MNDPEALSPSSFATTANAYVTQEDVGDLVTVAGEGPARLSLHTSPRDDLHAMVILQPHGNYAQPRLHHRKSKVFHIIAGELLVLTFTPDGELGTTQVLAQGETITKIVTHGVIHTNVALTQQAIYLEVMSGPFDRDDGEREFARFAPEQDPRNSGLTWLAERVDAWDSGLARRMQ